MIDKIDTNQIQPFLDKSLPRQSNPVKALSDNQADASLQVNYASLVKQAIQTQQTDAEAVQQARELLSSGQLESPENIRAAAENIIKFGI